MPPRLVDVLLKMEHGFSSASAFGKGEVFKIGSRHGMQQSPLLGRQVFVATDDPQANGTAAMTNERFRHLPFRRVIIKRHRFPWKHLSSCNSLPVPNHGIGVTTVIHEPPEITVENLFVGQRGTQVDVDIPACLN